MPAIASPAHHALPVPNSDIYQIDDILNEQERGVVEKVKAFMRDSVAPVVNEHWASDSFPFDLLPGFAGLGIAGTGIEGYGCPGGSFLLAGFLAMEIGRVDASIATFYGVHSGLAMGSIYIGGSEEQRQRWLPEMARLKQVGCFGLTEPLVGSGTGAGMLTTATRKGKEWVLNGAKRWIGNATWCDLSIIWARDTSDDQVKGFVVENNTTPGFSVDKMTGKLGLRIVQNGQITMDNCIVPEENRLQKAASFRDTAHVLRVTRQLAAWNAVGCSMGAYEAALAYAQTREQFGRPIASFQLIQDLLTRMIGNITASQCMMVRLAQLQDQKKLEDYQASLAKAYCTARMRETVSWAREVFGGNGILLEYNAARFFCDSEALYSYEGTREMNSLIVGKAVSGFSAFV